MNRPDLYKIANVWHEVEKASYPRQESRLILQTLRLVAKGQPVEIRQVEQVATELDVHNDAAHSIIDRITERDKKGRIVGLVGLSQNKWKHQFKVNGNTLSTWCALDTLFLPAMLKQKAEIETVDPETNEKIKLTIAPGKVEKYTPSEVILTIVLPDVMKENETCDVENIWETFCSFSHYFASIENGREWFSKKGPDPIFLTITEGYQLGQIFFEDILKYNND